MLEDFRSRMSDLRQEMEQLNNQAEDLERVVQEQQVRLEEMDLLVRQRDEQLAEQQSRVEELEATLRQRDQQLDELRAQLSEQEETLSQQSGEIEDLKAQLNQREETIAGLQGELTKREAIEAELRQQMAEAEARLAEPAVAPAAVPTEVVLDRFSILEEMLRQHGDSIARVHSLIEEELPLLHERLNRLETSLAETPLVERAVVVEEVAEPVVAEIEEEVVERPVEEAEEEVVAVAEVEVPPVEDPLRATLFETLEILPTATLVGLAGHDGLGVEAVVRGDGDHDPSLELELADLVSGARSVSAALEAGPLLTMAFQAGETFYLASPVGPDYFAFLLAPAGSMEEFRHAQAALLMVASRLSEFL